MPFLISIKPIKSRLTTVKNLVIVEDLFRAKKIFQCIDKIGENVKEIISICKKQIFFVFD